MKQILLTVTIITLYSQTSAQIQKGAKLLEGVISFNSRRTTGDFISNGSFVNNNVNSKTTSFSLQPKIGFFTSETFLVGIGAAYEYSHFKATSPVVPSYISLQKKNLYFLNPYVRKYFLLKENLFFTISLNLLIGRGREEYNWMGGVTNFDVVEWRTNITPGLTYFVSDQWAVTANFGQLFYNYRKETLDSDVGMDGEFADIEKDFGASFQFNTFGIGIQYYLRNKTE